MLLLSIIGAAVIAPFVYIIHDSIKLRKQVEVECEALRGYTKARQEIMLKATSDSDQNLDEAKKACILQCVREYDESNRESLKQYVEYMVACRKDLESAKFREEFLRK